MPPWTSLNAITGQFHHMMPWEGENAKELTKKSVERRIFCKFIITLMLKSTWNKNGSMWILGDKLKQDHIIILHVYQ